MLRCKATVLSYLFVSCFNFSSSARSQETAPPEAAANETLEEIVVQSTRTGRRVQDEPIRVEVLAREEIEEKLLMKPGNIATMLSETGGLRVQTTSPALGAANIRVQGLSGRYTQLLADGLPLYGGQAIGLLQVSPVDLGQVEVIKGAASALYGPSALGGVINLISRRPDTHTVSEFLLNATSRDGQDATAFVSGPINDGWSYSAMAGGHRQTAQDLDGDGWADMPGYDRWTLRPRAFWSGASGAKVFMTVGAMHETRKGGTLPGRTVPDGTTFAQTLESQRLDGGVVAEAPLGSGTLHLRASGMTQAHTHRFGPDVDKDQHDTEFAETSYAAKSAQTSWLAGVALQRDGYRSQNFAPFNYAYTAPGVFTQIEHDLRDDLTVAGSARLDIHNVYGTQFSPRVSVLYRPGPWTLRASVGRGFYAPTPFIDEAEDISLARLQPLNGLKAETAQTGSLEGGYSKGGLETTVTLFASRVKNAVQLEEPVAAGVRARLVNLPGTTRTQGAEFLARYRWDAVSVTGSYVQVDATEPDIAGAGRRTVPLTPHRSAGVVAMWEERDKGRLGIELYYTGTQRLDDNPYRAVSRPYWELGLLGEVVVGRARLFLNLENILNVRQSKYERLVRPQRAFDGRWTVDAWAPLDGFVVNGGVRVRFGEG